MKVRIHAYENIPDTDTIKPSKYSVSARYYEVEDIRVIEYMTRFHCEPLKLVDGGDGDFVLFDSHRTRWDHEREAIFRKVTDEGYRFIWAKSRMVLFVK